jgi:hypothetical protein
MPRRIRDLAQPHARGDADGLDYHSLEPEGALGETLRRTTEHRASTTPSPPPAESTTGRSVSHRLTPALRRPSRRDGCLRPLGRRAVRRSIDART